MQVGIVNTIKNNIYGKYVGAAGAIGAGVVVVSMTAKYVDEHDDGKPFSPHGERFDQSTFIGRYKKMISIFDPATLLYTKTQIMDYSNLLKRFNENQISTQAGTLDKNMNISLWRARKIKESAVHPDTGEIIPRPFRMSGYVPYGSPISVGMIVSQSTPALLFWNWVNQSQNACVNYFNRNASASVPSTYVTKEEAEANSKRANRVLANSYVTAVTAALAVAFGVSQYIMRRYPGVQGKKLLQFVALPSCCVASSLNAFIVRKPEMSTGITLFDANGNNVGTSGAKSKVAARKAVRDTVITRILVQFPVFLIPPLLMSVPPIATIAGLSSTIHLTLISFFTTVSFGLGLPAAVAWYPQIGAVAEREVEEEFKEAVANAPGQKLYYNRGM